MADGARGRGRHTTNAVALERVRKIETMITSGVAVAAVVRYAQDNWGISDRMARGYITKAYKALAAAADYDRQLEVGKAIVRLNGLYMLALESRDLRQALAVQKEINALLGLYVPVRQQLELSGGVQVSWKAAVLEAARSADVVIDGGGDD